MNRILFRNRVKLCIAGIAVVFTTISVGSPELAGQGSNTFGARPGLEGDFTRPDEDGQAVGAEAGDGSPVIMQEDGVYYMYTGGRGILQRRSYDGVHWERIGSVLPTNLPDWAQQEWGVEAGQTILWAPDISYFNGKYHLYYAVSELGKSHSAIGFATTETLDIESPQYGWTDHGSPILRTEHLPAAGNPDHFNAIDANVTFDEDKNPWLTYGSYWSGIKIQRLDSATGEFLPDAPRIDIARRTIADNGTRAVEAPFIVHKDPQEDGGWYYLFTSFDPQPTQYNVRVGRSRDIDGPYVDFAGVPLMEGGGTLVLDSYSNILAPGHNGIYQEPGGKDWFVHHYRDEGIARPSDGEAARTLMIRELVWGPDGWPVVGEPHNRKALGPVVEPEEALVGSSWKHAVNFNTEDASTLQFFEDGVIVSSKHPLDGQWSVDDQVLTMMWPKVSNPMEFWIDKVTLSEQGLWYAGRNQNGINIRGIRVSDFPIAYGDYNQDGAVDGADFLKWQLAGGDSVAHGTGADGDYSGIIDGADLVVWQQNFGTLLSASEIEAVPEARTMVLLVSAGLLQVVQGRYSFLPLK